MLSRYLQQPARPRRRAPSPSRRFRPGLEGLEERRVPATIQLIQNIGAVADATPGATTLTIPVTQAVAAGHDITVEFFAKSNGTPLAISPTVTDSAGNHYITDLTGVGSFAEASLFNAAAVAISPIPAGGSITVTFDASLTARAASAQEFYGIVPEAPLLGGGITGSNSTLLAGSVRIVPFTVPPLVLSTFGIADSPANTVTLDTTVPATTVLAGAGTTGAPGGDATIAPEFFIAQSPGNNLTFGHLTSNADWFAQGDAIAGDPTTHFEIDAAPVDPAGNVLDVTVKALDVSGNVDRFYTGTFHFASSDAKAVLPADTTFTLGDQGVKTFQVKLESAGLQTFTATDTVDGTIFGAASVNVQPGALDHFEVAAPAGTTAGSPFSFVVSALDAFNNVIPTYGGTVQFTGSDGQATLPVPYTFTTGQGGDDGVHTFTGVTLRTAGPQTIDVADTLDGAALASTSVAVSPGAAAAFAMSHPATIAAGLPFNLIVKVEDAYGNVVPTFTGTLTFGSSDRRAVLPANYTFTAADQGVHTFSVTIKTPGTDSITVSELGDPLLVDVLTVFVKSGSSKGNK
jgi:hypothetical protein